MAKPDEYGVNDPLHMIVDQLIKWEKDKQAEETYGIDLPDTQTLIRRAATYRNPQ